MMETAAPTAPAVAAVPAKGLFERAIGVVTSPKATYQDVVAHPSILGILLLTSLIMGMAQGIPQMTERGRQNALNQQLQMAERFGQSVPAEAIPAIEQRIKIGAYVAVPVTMVFTSLACLFFAALYWVGFNVVLGGTASFKQVLAVVAHANVIGALGFAIGAPIMYMQNNLSMGGPFNLAILVPMLDPKSVIVSVLGATSVFTIWGWLNTGTGLGVLFKRNGVIIGLVLMAVFFTISFGIATVLSSFRS